MIKAKSRKGECTMSDRKVFHDSVIPLPQQPGLTTHGLLIAAAEPQQGEETMDVHFALAPSPTAEQQLEARVARGEVVPSDELARIYTAPPADADALKAW